MKKILLFTILISPLIFSTALIFSEASADTSLNLAKRDKNINLIVIIDVSKSMVNNFKTLQDYTYNSIIRKVLIDKDYFNCFTFGEFIRPRIEKTLEMPQDIDALKSGIYSIIPDENFTDIGMALENLGSIISSKKLPYERSIVFFITDGKNIPPKTSKYSGVDIFAEGAFKFYSEIKSGDFKVMLLSIGPETAASDLSKPLGGEFIEVSSTLSTDDLNEKIQDFMGSVEMGAALKNNNVNEKTIVLTLSSTYTGKKQVKINDVSISIDGQKITVQNVPSAEELNPGEMKKIELNFELPKNISEGNHEINVEINSENNLITKSVQKIGFIREKSVTADHNSSPFMIFSIIFSGITLLVLTLYLIYMFNIVLIGKKRNDGNMK
jgi:hypothetical protein